MRIQHLTFAPFSAQHVTDCLGRVGELKGVQQINKHNKTSQKPENVTKINQQSPQQRVKRAGSCMEWIGFWSGLVWGLTMRS